MTRNETFDLIAARLEEAREQHLYALEADIFCAVSEAAVSARLDKRSRSRWQTAKVRLSQYFDVLWGAVRGDDPYDDSAW